MKKVLITILAFLYLVTSSDAAITIHYCMGRVYSIGLLHNDLCGKCGMKKTDGCCKDEVKIVKVQDKQQLASKPEISFFDYAFIQSQPIDFNYIILKRLSNSATHNNSPPGRPNVSISIMNCVFLI